MGVTAAVISAVTATAGTVHAVESSAQQKRLAGQARQRQGRAQQAERDRVEREKFDAQTKESATAQLQAQSRRQRQAQSQTQGRQGAILGGDTLGIASNAAAKTKLGQ